MNLGVLDIVEMKECHFLVSVGYAIFSEVKITKLQNEYNKVLIIYFINN